jgi:hypothetical protein
MGNDIIRRKNAPPKVAGRKCVLNIALGCDDCSDPNAKLPPCHRLGISLCG